MGRRSEGSKLARRFRKYRTRLQRQWLLLRYALANRLGRRRVVAEGGPVVSLTSYSTRLRKVHVTLESIAAGRLLPSRLILWVDEEKTLADLPAPLRRLQARGLEVKRCNNYGPHKKYFPYVQGERIGAPLVTADDDVLYPGDWLAGLQAAHRQTPEQVVCYMAKQVGIEGGVIQPYHGWTTQLDKAPSVRNFAIGVSGVLYPAALQQVLKREGEAFVQVTPRADDIWLHWQALRSGVKVRQISDSDEHFLSVPGTQDIALYSSNLKQGGNDQVIARLYTADDIATMLKDRS
ncbi:hypothetical protein HNP46_005032 [Pseudomonas nitritireducens]|uniref:Glycosyltransferase n=1 Tax=Pseudomonas nitroreducens TaxID=46680 RepID=A0A7W7KNL5_PSENT|nr:hypothetical protein [Pseudomonas nitritireducens]MBB4866127.1 hypothetical protein [Pseudomonas nitritireducens]